MAKRLSNSEKWEDEWFCNLKERDRLFWIFLLDKCDHAGLWRVNRILVEFYFPGYKLDSKVFGDRVLVTKKGNWFIMKFIEFQYGHSQEKRNRNKAFASVWPILEKEGLDGLIR